MWQPGETAVTFVCWPGKLVNINGETRVVAWRNSQDVHVRARKVKKKNGNSVVALKINCEFLLPTGRHLAGM